MNNNRFILQPSQEQGFWVATDNENEIEIKFREHEFNETQEVTLLGDKQITASTAQTLATAMRELADWLSKEHYNIAMPSLLYDRKRIGQQIRDYRMAEKMSQADLARRAGITTANICNIEAGKYSVGLDILNRIANALGKTFEFSEK